MKRASNISVFASIAILFSCSDDGVVDDSCSPLRIESTYSSGAGGGSGTSTIFVEEYHFSNGKIASVSNYSMLGAGNKSETSPVQAGYDSDNKLILLSDGNNVFEFTYESLNRVKYINVLSDGTIRSRYEYEYNKHGQLAKQSLYVIDLGGTGLLSVYTFEYADNETKNFHTKKYFERTSTEASFTYHYEWDQMPSPYSVLPEVFGIDKGENNITRITLADADNRVTSVTYSYEYYANGFPKTQMAISTAPPEIASSVTFEYNCN